MSVCLCGLSVSPFAFVDRIEGANLPFERPRPRPTMPLFQSPTATAIPTLSVITRPAISELRTTFGTRSRPTEVRQRPSFQIRRNIRESVRGRLKNVRSEAAAAVAAAFVEVVVVAASRDDIT